MKTIAARLAAICERYGAEAVYAFGSRAAEVAAFVQERGVLESKSSVDVDVGVLPGRERLRDIDERVRLTADLEDLLNVPRVDLVVLPQAAPYFALDVVSGERLFRLRRSGRSLTPPGLS